MWQTQLTRLTPLTRLTRLMGKRMHFSLVALVATEHMTDCHLIGIVGAGLLVMSKLPRSAQFVGQRCVKPLVTPCQESVAFD